MAVDVVKSIAWWLAADASVLDHVFVVGAPRSGTTLLQLLISAHSQFLACEGESGVFTRNNLFDLRRRFCGLSETEVQRLQDKCTNIVGFFDAIAESVTDGDLRLVEKTPQHVLLLQRLLRWFPESQFVHIVRDGRDCYCSSKLNRDVPQRISVGRFARYWRRCIRARNAAGESHMIFDLRYEDLTLDPEYRLRNVMTFLGTGLEAGQMEARSRSADSRSKHVAFSRLAQPVGAQSVGRWKEELSEEEVRKFQSIAGAELRQFGYKLT